MYKVNLLMAKLKKKKETRKANTNSSDMGNDKQLISEE